MNENNIRNSTYEYAVKQIIDYTAIYGGDRHNIWIAINSPINLLWLTQARNTQFQSLTTRCRTTLANDCSR